MRRGTGSRALPTLPVFRRRVAFSTNRKSYILSVISVDSVDYVNQFYNSINTQFYMFMSAPKKVKLVSRKCLKLNSMLHPA